VPPFHRGARHEKSFFVCVALACGIILNAPVPAEAQHQQPPTVAKLKQLLSDTTQVNAINVEGKSLNIVVNDRQISVDLYVALLITTCNGLGTDSKRFEEIGFGNRFAEQGYIFKSPPKCAELVKMPIDRRLDAILAETDAL
jgi:hypothetical protein